MPSELQKLKGKLDKVYSEYIRRRDSDKDGMGHCCTCGKSLHWKQGHCCHFVSRNHLATRWEEKNTHLGCVGCNIYGRGKFDEYAVFLEEKYGEGILQALCATKHKTIKMSRSDYETKIEEYKQKLKDLERGKDEQGTCEENR